MAMTQLVLTTYLMTTFNNGEINHSRGVLWQKLILSIKTNNAGEVQFLIDELENLTLTNLFTFMTMKQTPIMKFVLQPIVTFLKARIKLAFHCVSLTNISRQRKAIINGNDIVISHQKNSNTLAVHNSSTDIIIQKVVLYNDWTDYQHLEGRKSIARENTVTSQKCWCMLQTSNYKWHVK
jgi:hypothetical protein